MGASVRFLHSPCLNRHLLFRSSINIPHHRISSRSLPSQNPNPIHVLNLSSSISPRSAPFSSLSLSISNVLSSSSPDHQKGAFHIWDRVIGGDDLRDVGLFGERGKVWTVVLLGWLGAEHKHLKRYAEIYNSRGIRSVRFVAPVREFLGFDMGRRVEDRIGEMARDLASWCSEREKDGRERRLIFHTFSNTGWLSYGAILESWQSRSDIIEKIDGCVIDSGPAPELCPQVWAAGFCAALLKKRSSLTHSSAGVVEGDKPNGIDIRPSLTETITLSVLEKFFSIVLFLPDINQRLSRIISTLSRNQPPCPQLYLYSSADKVVPGTLVEGFMQQQKELGRDVRAHDFGSSPHVDHLRSFPQVYTAKVNEFLKDCLSSADSRTM